MIEAAKDLIRKHEGLRLTPYKCPAGKWSIGYGRNMEDNGISKDEAEDMLHNDVIAAIEELDDKLPWFLFAPENIRTALIDMRYNMGWPRLSGFKKMLAAMEVKNYRTAALEALDSRWATQVGQRSQIIAKLIREAE